MQYSSLHRYPPLKTCNSYPPLKTCNSFLFILGLIVFNNHIRNIQPIVTNYVRNRSDCFFNISEDRHFVLGGDGCCRPLRGKRRRVSNMALDCIFFIWDHALFYGCVCIVHMNNSANITCIVCNCTSVTLANSLNNVSTSRSSSSRSLPPK